MTMSHPHPPPEKEWTKTRRRRLPIRGGKWLGYKVANGAPHPREVHREHAG
jgi:hypothetical protein